MNTNLTQIAIVLDRSGSMGSVVRPTIDSFNEFIALQKHEPGEARLMLVQFDQEYQFLYNKPLKEVEDLNTKTFVPRGSTALLDAIGRTIDDLGKQLDAMPQNERPGRVVVAIITDGGENASKDYGDYQYPARVAAMVDHQQKKYNWRFVFLGANQDAILTARGLNIGAGQALTYTASAAGTAS